MIETPATEHDSDESVANAAEQIYNVLEGDIVPMYYDVDGDGLPTRWLPVMKHAICAAGRRFTSLRMLMEYVGDFYVPALEGLAPNDAAPA